jgi:hypothetical protein
MRTEHLDNKINELETLRSRGELTYMGGEMLSEFNEIKQALTIPVVVNQRELLLKKQSDWLMIHTKLEVENIVSFTEEFKQ